MDRTDTIAVVLANRAYLYAVLSRAFAQEADAGFLAFDGHFVEECALLDNEAGEGSRLACAIMEAASSEGAEERLRDEYMSLMIGPGEMPVPPWESVFVSKEKLLFQESTLLVRRAYARAGYRSAGYPHEADDHIAVELNFMAALAKRTLDAFEADDGGEFARLLDVQRTFLAEHLLVWIGEYAERMQALAGFNAFYPSFAALAALVCRRDAEVLEELSE